MENKLSVVIPCKNEAANIEACIASVRPVADEIIVADSGSEDGTLEKVKSLGGCRIIQREYVCYGSFVGWAITHARYPWVLVVDADERLTPELAREIHETLQHGPQYDGYWIYRENYFLGHRIRFSGWQHDRCLRLYRKELVHYEDRTHAHAQIAGHRVGRLRHRMKHYTTCDLEHFLKKQVFFVTSLGDHAWQAGKRPSVLRLVAKAPLRFFHTYFLRGGILDGVPGLIVCMMTAYYSFLKEARLWQRYYARDLRAAEGTPAPPSMGARAA